MRLFVALVPPAAVVAQVRAGTAAARAAAPGLRWVPPDRLHLTLAFLGEVPDDRVPELTAALARACAPLPRPRLALHSAGRFGGRVLWAGVQGATADLERLAAACGAAAARCGVPLEDRPYRAHLTLARAREPYDLAPLVALLDGLRAGPWTARSATLVRSRPGRLPAYEPLAALPLAAPGGG
ncbi:RNA 2',3'-cyclic phosphodiesterase [Vallicoccus soli]|uniref:RNA 2',3'-cyclic phosphodiesterase n=1 Tax=Vallicoccus soli TaxID=2339232 RepID=UPI001403A6E5|nr:RNA 2',3'-cyclic phosphodiesterase [Vallicoccus soli]